MSLAIKANRFRFIILVFSFIALLLWICYGWDSGIEQVYNPEMYGKSLHFSAMVTYGLLFIYTSKHIETWEIKGFKNIFYSGLLTALNIGLFEGTYILLFQHFQLDGIIAGINRDWFFLSQYVFLTLAGVVGVLGLVYEVTGRVDRRKNHSVVPQWNNNTTVFLLSWTLILGFMFWILYPGPVTTLTYGTWTNSRYFPQTHYAYVNSSLYSSNFFLHGVNITVKALFALLQLQILRLWRKKNDMP